MKIAVDNSTKKTTKTEDKKMIIKNIQQCIESLETIKSLNMIVDNANNLEADIVMRKKLLPDSPITKELQSQYAEVQKSNFKIKSDLKAANDNYSELFNDTIAYIQEAVIGEDCLTYIFEDFGSWFIKEGLPLNPLNELYEPAENKTLDLIGFYHTETRMRAHAVMILDSFAHSGRARWRRENFDEAIQHMRTALYYAELLMNYIGQLEKLSEKIGDPDTLEALKIISNNSISDCLGTTYFDDTQEQLNSTDVELPF